MAIQIISDSSCDIPLNRAKDLDLDIIPFYVSLDGNTYKKELIDVKTRDFYQNMIDNPKVFPKTSLPSIQDYIERFEFYAKEGKDIICVCITDKFSGSFNSASNAAEIIKDKYPDIKIHIINSKVNTVLQGLIVKEILRMRDNELTFEEIISNTEKIIPSARIIFTIGGISYLVHGGRVGKVLSIAASKLRIIPIITLKDGEIFPSGITHNRKVSLNKVLEKTKSHFDDKNININNFEFAIGYGYDIEEAENFTAEFKKILAGLGYNKDISFEQIGATISVHTGPQPLGIGFVERYDA